MGIGSDRSSMMLGGNYVQIFNIEKAQQHLRFASM